MMYRSVLRLRDVGINYGSLASLIDCSMLTIGERHIASYFQSLVEARQGLLEAGQGFINQGERGILFTLLNKFWGGYVLVVQGSPAP